MSNLIIADADKNLAADVCYFFRSIGHNIQPSHDVPAALQALQDGNVDVVIADVELPGGTAAELARAALERNPDALIIVTPEVHAVQEGVQAVQAGAFGILQKPYSIPELNFRIKKALERRSLSRESAVRPAAEAGQEKEAEPERFRGLYQPYNFIGESPGIRKIFRIVSRVAGSDSSVIILGETGTGKELVAGAIHYNSARSEGPFVRVNCAALPEQLLESELFGYEKGAFTGAERLRIGRFEQANGGTIFLDEVGDMSPLTQAKVLRVIQEKEFERLGSNETVKTDVRIISATNKDLRALIDAGQFREDLYYRLNVITLRLPPLRERDGDIGLLVQFFLDKFAQAMKKRVRGIEPGALQILTSYRWPGNIRELENAIERAVLLAEGETITAEDLNLFFTPEPSKDTDSYITLPPEGIRLEEAERLLVVQALERTGWVQKEAAALLGLSTRVLNYKVKQFGITHPRWRQNR